MDFFVCPFGCKNAGFTVAEMASLFLGHKIPRNVVMNSEFAKFLAENDPSLTFGKPHLLPHSPQVWQEQTLPIQFESLLV